MSKITRALALLTLAASGAALAQVPAQTEPDIPAPESDRTNYSGDKLNVRASVVARTFEYGQPPGAGTLVCIKKRTRLEGLGAVVLNERRYQVFAVQELPAEPQKDAPRGMLTSMLPDTSRDTVTGCSTVSTTAAVGQIVIIDDGLVAALPATRTGLSYGTLLVPYKYHLGGDKSFTGSTSLGGYLGWRFNAFSASGLSTKAVVFMGAASVPVSQVNDGVTTTQQMTGLTYGLGVLGEVKDAFQLGIVVGADRVSKSAHYVNDGKPWIAVSLGFGFSN